MQLSLSFNCTIRLNVEQTENKENENDTVYASNANMRMRVIHRIGGMGCACAKFKNDDFLNFFCFEKGHAPTIGNFSLEFIEAVIVLFFFFSFLQLQFQFSFVVMRLYTIRNFA